jgi:cytochrome c2
MDITCTKSHKPFWITFSLLLLSLFTFNASFAQDGNKDSGAKLFKQNCAVCHSTGTNVVTGPGLSGVMSRVPSKEWLHDWIKNADAMKKKGDAYAVKVDKDFPSANMNVFTFLSDQEISDIIAYVEAPPAPTGPTGGTGLKTEGPKEEAKNGIEPLFVLLAIIAFLVILIAVLRSVRHSLRNVVDQKQGLPETPATGMWVDTKSWMNRNKRIVALIVIILVGYLSKLAWDGMMSIGIYEGYHPTQPIKFSHKIHAGDNAIACVYCHSSVEKSKTAGIPPVSTCMNCHKGIQQGPNTGTEEIAKIYTAAGFDPTTGQYSKPKQPLEWVKVHNLPDFVYFNHSQHVVVGKRECEECHGDVKTMETVQQMKPLTMGWCIDCHRKTEVAMEDNPYYEKLHKRLAEKYKGQPITVDKMGGIDCGRCHY